MNVSRHLHGYLSFWWFSSVGPKTVNHVRSLKSFVLRGSYDVIMILVSIYYDMTSFLNDWIICSLIFFSSGCFSGSLMFSDKALPSCLRVGPQVLILLKVLFHYG
jgi:hypothetical protein